MIWLQTETFFDWSFCEIKEEEDLEEYFDKNNFPNDYSVDDVAVYILGEVLHMAADYHNQRIDTYLYE